MLKIYLVQMEAVLNDKKGSFRKVRDLIAQCEPLSSTVQGQSPAGLIILPEMFATGYIPEDPIKYAEDFGNAAAGETAGFLSDLANETGCAVLGAGISFAPNATGDTPLLQNHSSLYLPGCSKEVAHYNKRKPFFPEKDFLPGDSINLFKINEWNIATAICYDLRFPELFRDAVKAGAKLITIQAAWPEIRKEHWITLLKARAIENQVYVAAANQYGNSMIISPTGEVLCQGEQDECVIFGTVLSAPQEEYRRNFPVLKGIV